MIKGDNLMVKSTILLEKQRTERRIAEKRTRLKNSNNCFGIREYFILVFAIVFFTLPFLSIFMIRANGGYNNISWDEYYGQNANYEYYITGDYNNDTEYDGTSQRFELDRVYQEFLIPLEDRTYQTIRWGSYHYQFKMNSFTSSDLIFCSRYQFPEKNTFDYFPFIYNLPIGLSTYRDTTKTLEKTSAIIPYNWTGVWDYVSIYFYYADKNGNGIGFHFGNRQSANESRDVTLSTEFGDLSLQVFDVNMSGYIVWNSPNSVSFYYDNKPIEKDTYLNDYLGIVYGLFGDVEQNIETLLESLPFLGGSIDLTGILNYNSLLVDISQCLGFPSRNYLPFVKTTQCGYYIHIDKDFDIMQYIDYNIAPFPAIKTIGDYFLDAGNTLSDDYVNGISIYDGGLYLGKIISIQQNLQQVLIWNIIIIFGLLGVLIIVGIYLDYPKKLREYQVNQQRTCVLK